MHDVIWANIYMSDEIVSIDKETGRVLGSLDGFGLTVSSSRPYDAGAVLNGIAFDRSSGTFIVTGKLWPRAFQIRVLD